MKNHRTVFAFLIALVLLGPSSALCKHAEQIVPQLDREKLPGRQVKVAAICIGFGGDHGKKLKLAIDHLHTAGKNGVDIACLPEEFAGTNAEPVPGPTTKAVMLLAKQYGMYVICPIREQAGDRQYNTAILIDRQGKIAGWYRKVFVFWGEGLHCSTEGAKVFDTDFGKIGILTCFDLNFPELWQQCEDLDADIVFWPSAYSGGAPLNAYAILYHYYIVPVGVGNIIDITGQTLKDVEKPRNKQFIATLDLDRSFIHSDFHREKVNKLLAEHGDEIQAERVPPTSGADPRAPWWLLRATKPGVRVRTLLKEYGIERLHDYQKRSRKQINERRNKGQRV